METKERPKHSPIGASSCERWWNCPGSVKLSEGIPNEDTKYTTLGSVAHGVAERELNQRIAEVPRVSIWEEEGRSYVSGGFEHEVDEDMIEAVQVYLDLIDEYRHDFALEYSKHIRTEVKFDLTHIDPEAYGTCDCVIVVPGYKLVILDYKHGQGHMVEVENNHQLLYYALGAYYDTPLLLRSQIDLIETVIVQPRGRHLHGQVRSHTYTVADLLRHEEDLASAIKRVRRVDKTLAAGPWCTFCRAKPVCPKIREDIERETAIVFGPIETKDVDLPSPAALTPDHLGMLKKNADKIIKFGQAIIGMCEAVADRGTNVTGFKLVRKYGKRRWLDEKQVEAMYNLEFGERIFDKKLKSPAKIEKILGKKRQHEIVEFFETPVVGKSLVPVDDPREEAPDNLTEAFATPFEQDLGV